MSAINLKLIKNNHEANERVHDVVPRLLNSHSTSFYLHPKEFDAQLQMRKTPKFRN